MKLFFSFFLVFFFSTCLSAKNLEVKYFVKTKGLVIGELSWKLKLLEKEYTTSVDLKSKGVVSAIYRFNGLYESFGEINNKKLSPNKYSQKWVTKSIPSGYPRI